LDWSDDDRRIDGTGATVTGGGGDLAVLLGLRQIRRRHTTPPGMHPSPLSPLSPSSPMGLVISLGFGEEFKYKSLLLDDFEVQIFCEEL
jgi:hypothetical protein